MDYDTVGAFIDNYLVVLAARHQANLEDAGDESWQVISDALQGMLRHPNTHEERTALRWVDVLHFTPAVCHHRAQYIFWRSKKQREERRKGKKSNGQLAVKPSGFNVLTGSLKDEIDQLMADARSKLPSAKGTGGAMGVDSDDDDDDDAPVEIYRPPKEMLVEEIDVQQAEAEAHLLQRVQELQLEHYKKYKRWVETHIPTESPLKEKQQQQQEHQQKGGSGGRSGLVSEDAIEDIPLDQCTTAQIAELMDHLGISEHKNKFRRTTGKLLLMLKKEDLRERFGDDFEGADILWAHIEENRVPVATSSRVKSTNSAAAANTRKFYDEFRTPGSTFQTQLRSYDEARARSSAVPASANKGTSAAAVARHHNQQQNLEECIAAGDISALKRSMNPNRPPRPSEATDYSTSEDDMAYENYGRGYLASVQSDASNTPPAVTPEKKPQQQHNHQQQQSAAIAAAAMGRHVDPRVGVTAAAAARTAPAAAATTTSSRAGRWEIQEYDDEDSD